MQLASALIVLSPAIGRQSHCAGALIAAPFTGVAMSAPAQWGSLSTQLAIARNGPLPKYDFRQGSPFGRSGRIAKNELETKRQEVEWPDGAELLTELLRGGEEKPLAAAFLMPELFKS